MEKGISTLLHRLGITTNYFGFYYLSDSIQLLLDRPERLTLVTKWLYPDVAKKNNTTPERVERNMRTTIRLAWSSNPVLVAELAGRPLSNAPTVTQMLSYLLRHFMSLQTRA